ncbi:MAG: ABC transporter ATP-binding protein [Steroidobacteraceae bacterium]|jgi:iron complex transport system ATP-binding protein|nr:ABC transporter ATP-binding protein [Steroidobacteraceae bacterium]
MLACEGLDVRVAGRCLVRSLTASFGPGRLVAVLGRNGVGKTLTLHTLAGQRAADAGVVTLDGRPLGAWPRRALARRLSLLPQSTEDPFPTTVIETALIGRHPHLGFWQWEGPAELALARRALADVDLAGFESRELDTLSGGERRRLAVATLLTQDPGICLLDEPTNHLDPAHQLAVLGQFRRRVDAGGTVIASLHDATLAARFADAALLLFGDGRWEYGDFTRVVTPTALGALYGSPVAELAWQGRRVFVGA